MIARLRCRVLLLLAMAAPGCALAIEREGVQFPDRVQLAGQELQLNGTGVRSVATFKGYVAALYLPRRAASVEDVLAQSGPKRLRLVMLISVPTVELARAFDKGVKRNSAPHEQEALRERLARMVALMQVPSEVHRGDVVDLEYEPAHGTRLLLNSKPRGEPIAGADFYAATVRAFIGVRPYQKSMRAQLLGAPP